MIAKGQECSEATRVATEDACNLVVFVIPFS